MLHNLRVDSVVLMGLPKSRLAMHPSKKALSDSARPISETRSGWPIRFE